ncbi:MAG: metallophosphoesterase, partial [Clostridia bacterium]|nr:metallophosphoesterase [Clostridia bacterium]
HSCYYGENQSEIIDATNIFNPDAVLLGGDIFDDVLDEENAKILVKELAKKYPTYYVSGNHEWWSNKMYDFFDYITSSGCKVLRGNSEYITVGKNKISICGIDDPEVNRYDALYTCWEEQLENLGNGLKADCLNILLSHRPENIDKYAEYDFDIVMSGHAHGGQFRIPFVLNGFCAPGQGFFPEYAGGVYDIKDKKFIVSRGLSDENSRLPRIYNKPELVFVNVNPY